MCSRDLLAEWSISHHLLWCTWISSFNYNRISRLISYRKSHATEKFVPVFDITISRILVYAHRLRRTRLAFFIPARCPFWYELLVEESDSEGKNVYLHGEQSETVVARATLGFAGVYVEGPNSPLQHSNCGWSEEHQCAPSRRTCLLAQMILVTNSKTVEMQIIRILKHLVEIWSV